MALVIFWLSDQNRPSLKLLWVFQVLDGKLAHFLGYGFLAFLTLRAVNREELWEGTEIKSIFLALLITVLFAASDEIHQTIVTTRHGEVRDVLIDSLGAFLSLILCSIGYLTLRVVSFLRETKHDTAFD